MKKILLIIVLVQLAFFSVAQAPQGFSYQAVATDSLGVELTDSTISIRVSILSDSIGGAVHWEETHAVTTDNFGLFTLTVGQGSRTGGVQTNFSDISWGEASHYLKVEIDVTGGSTYKFMGTSQMMSVPYALYAEQSGSSRSGVGFGGVADLSEINNFLWAKDGGNISSNQQVNDITTDPSGNVLATGWFVDSIEFDTVKLFATGNQDVFVVKFTKDGQILWAINIGEAGKTYESKSIVCDQNGNSYITESIWGNKFLIKVNSNGNFSFLLNPTSGTFTGKSLAIDDLNYIYCTGIFNGAPATIGGVTLNSTLSDAFVTKIDTNGNVIWAVQGTGAGSEAGFGIVVDTNNYVYVTGEFNPPATFGSTTLSSFGGNSTYTFITKLNSSGNFQWAKAIASSSTSHETVTIAVDNSGNSYSIGNVNNSSVWYESLSNKIINNTTTGSVYYPFIVKLDSNGGFVWAKYAEYGTESKSTAIYCDGAESIFMGGYVKEKTYFDNFLINPIYGYINGAIIEYNLNGEVVSVWTVGSTRENAINTFHIDGNKLYVGGYFRGKIFTKGGNISAPTLKNNAFIIKVK